jgi:hypothetical protein
VLDLEARQLRDGEYVAVRRFTRILERGPDAKAEVDQVGRQGQACGQRTALLTTVYWPAKLAASQEVLLLSRPLLAQ